MAELCGGCLCGRVRYALLPPPLDAGYCHCRLCQRSAGAPVLAWLSVAAERFAWTAETPAVFASSAGAQREFCGRCGTQLVFRPSPPAATVDVTIASLDDPAAVRPGYHIWRASRLAWFDTSDRLPRHDDAGPDRLG